jgi:MFS family permease
LYLIIAGELIFALPFHINRFFRPSLLEELQITNSMMGIAFTIYGLTALICYFPGGYIADRFDP